MLKPGVGGVMSKSAPPSGIRDRLVPRAIGPRKVYDSEAMVTA